MSEAVAKKNGTLPKERPRFAWWRNLHCQANRTWEGDGSSTFVHLPVVKRASPHLKWAKQVHTQQQTWLAQHCKLCKPLPKRSVGARVPRPRGPKRSRALRESTGSLPTLLPLFGTVLQWATDLRGDATELAARAKEERRELQQRRACGLQRLRETQQQWRRDQRGRQKQRQPSPEASPPSTAHEVFKPGRVRQSLESVESEDESSSDQSSKSSFGDGENSDQFGPIDRFDRPSFAESTSGSSSAEGHATFTEQRQPVAQTSMLRRNSVQRQGLLTQPVVGITAKDAEGGDISLEELFDAGSEDARQAEVHVSKVNTLAADDLMISLLTRNISGSDQEGFRRAATPDVLPTALHEEFAASTRRKCETWRAEFPLEVLDQLAAAFDSWQEEDGCRKSSVRNLCQVLRYTLGWPPKILQEVLQDQSQEELYFKRLSDLLELMREALQLAEMEEPDVLWSDWDLNLVKESFRRFASKASSTMPVVNLFQAIHVLGFEELEVDSPDRQRWLAGITKEVLARKASRASLSVETSRRESWSAGPTSRVGAGAQLSFRDFLRVASRALRELEKEMRIDEFRAETKAVKIGNYGLLELEDMRELHSSFCSLKASMRSNGGKGNLDAMQELFQRCGVPALDAADVDRLRTLLRPAKDSHHKEQAATGADDVSFVVFLRWVREMRQTGIEGLAALRLSRSDEVSLQDLESRRGFHAAVLKEQFHIVWENSEDTRIEEHRVRAESSVSKVNSGLSARSARSAQDKRPPQ